MDSELHNCVDILTIFISVNNVTVEILKILQIK